MKKTLLFLSCLVASVGAFAAYSSSDAQKYINTAAGCTFSTSYLETTTKHFTVLVDVPEGQTFTIENMTFENNNTTTVDGTSIQKNWSVLGVQGTGKLILKNCTFKNPNKGAGVQVYSGATVDLYDCNVEVSGYRGFASCALQAQGGEYAVMNVYSGKYVSNSGAALLICTSGGQITTYGGTFISNATNQPWLYSSNVSENSYTGAIFCDGVRDKSGGKFFIEGGTFYGAVYHRNEGGTKINITKGRFYTKEMRYGAGCKPAGQTIAAIGNYISFDGWHYVGYGDEYQYKRESIGEYNTACFNRVPTSTNVTFYYPYEMGDAMLNIVKVELKDMVAGKPYIYLNPTDSAYFTFATSDTPAAITANNGLVGTIEGINYNVLSQSVISTSDATLVNKYLLNSDEWDLNESNGAYLLPCCAYYTMDDPEDPAFVMNVIDLPTACAKVSATSAQDGKMIIDGKLFIRRNGQLFSVLGNAVE